MAANIAMMLGIPGLYLNLEMMREDLIRRIVSSLTEVLSDDILCGTYSDERQWKAVQDMLDVIGETGTLFITENKPQTISNIVSQIYHFKNRHDIKVVFIDHLGAITPDEMAQKEKNSSMTYGRYIQLIKDVCAELDLRCVILHQFNRQGDKNSSRSNISLSWQILQKADVMIALYEKDDVYWLEIQKHRHKGGKYKIPLHFRKEIHK